MASKDVVLSARVPRHIADQIKHHCESTGTDVSGFLQRLVARELSIEIGRKRPTVNDLTESVRELQTQLEKLHILASLTLCHQLHGDMKSIRHDEKDSTETRVLRMNHELERATSQLVRLAPKHLAKFEPAIGASVVAPTLVPKKG